MTTKNESPSPSLTPEMVALIGACVGNAVTAALAEKQPKFDQTTDLLSDRARMIAERDRVQTWSREFLHPESQTAGVSIWQPSASFPEGRIIRVENLRLSEARERAIFETALGGETKAFQKLALYMRHGPTPGMTDEEMKRIEREAQVNGSRVREIERAAQHQIKGQTFTDLIQPCRRLVGMSFAEAKRYATFGTITLLDEGLRSPFKLPSSEV
jgi:hypothetical protein